MKKIEISILVVGRKDGNIVAYLDDPECPLSESGLDSEVETFNKLYKLDLKDHSLVGIGFLPAAAYEAMQSIDKMSDIPHMCNLLRQVAAAMFREGMKYQADQEVKPQMVQ